MNKDIKLRSYKFSISVIQFIDSLQVKRVFISMIDQLLKSATSIGANLAEARAAHSKKDFIKYYEISLKSSNETKYWLCLMRDGLKLPGSEIKILLNEADEISKILGSIIVKLKNSKTNLVKEKSIIYKHENSEIHFNN